MIFFSVIAFIFLLTTNLDLHNFLSDLISYFHGSCLSRVPNSIFHEVYAAIVCGKDLNNPELFTVFKETGLLHILVVSGAHLIFISNSLKILRVPFQLPILALYSLMAGAEAPVVRAVVQLTLETVSERLRLRLRPTDLILCSGLFTWVLQPLWITSLSFQLSWVCAILLAQLRTPFQRAIGIYLATGFLLSPLQWPHPITVLMNLTLAPIIGGVAFPLSAVSFVFPQFTLISDGIWGGIIWLCEKFTPQNGIQPGDISLVAIWFLIWSLHTLHIFEALWKKRQI